MIHSTAIEDVEAGPGDGSSDLTNPYVRAVNDVKLGIKAMQNMS